MERQTTKRDQWSSKKIYWLTQIGSAIGLGNLWRFPYLAFKNGGGAFVIPYLLSLTFIGMPLFLLELAFGQLYKQGIVGALNKIHSKFIGVGLFHIWTTLLILSYYCTILTWVLNYVVISFMQTLPFKNNAENYFLNTFLNTKSRDSFQVNGWLVLFLALIWIAIFLCVSKGIKVMGKVSVILMPICPILLLVLLFRGLALEGASTGILYYITPQFEMLLRPGVWMDAAGQIFFSIGLAGGVIPALASYASNEQDLVIDTFVITCSNSFVELSAGFIVFSYLGNLAKTLGVPVHDVAASGPALAFIVFPEALAKMPGSNVFCVLFFVTLLLLGITSAYTMVQSIVTSAKDFWPRVNISFIAAVVCLLEFLFGIVYTTPMGYSLVDIVDHYTSIMLLIGGFAECIVVLSHSISGSLRALPDEGNRKPFVYHFPIREESNSFYHDKNSLFLVEYLRKCINKRTMVLLPKPWSYSITWFNPVITVVMIFSTIIVAPAYNNYSSTLQFLFGWLPLSIGFFLILAFVFFHSKARERLSFLWHVYCIRKTNRNFYNKLDIEMKRPIE